jgi:hypothetical protein
LNISVIAQVNLELNYQLHEILARKLVDKLSLYNALVAQTDSIIGFHNIGIVSNNNAKIF